LMIKATFSMDAKLKNASDWEALISVNFIVIRKFIADP